MPKWPAHTTDAQRARFREAISRGAKRSWQRGRKGNHRFPKGREAALYAQGLRPSCARFYWLARCIGGYHNPTWTTPKIIKRINWITKHYGTGPEGFRAWAKWLIGTHRIGQHEHMKPEYRHRLPEIEANYQAWMAKLNADRRPCALFPELTPVNRAPEPPKLPAVREPVDVASMPEEFAKSTALALRAQQAILEMPLDEDDPHFKAKLAAKASTASQQITAQLRADENRLKGQLATVSYYDELKVAIAQYKATST
jgi:hypothetical protein